MIRVIVNQKKIEQQKLLKYSRMTLYAMGNNNNHTNHFINPNSNAPAKPMAVKAKRNKFTESRKSHYMHVSSMCHTK
jgi:hypothetical protein